MATSMNLEEIALKMDAAFHYPGEALLEYWLPGVDRWIDKILYAILSVEEIATEGNIKPQREQMAVDILQAFWNAIPMPFFIRQWMAPLFEPIVRGLIRQAVAWLNDAIGHNWPKVTELEV